MEIVNLINLGRGTKTKPRMKATITRIGEMKNGGLVLRKVEFM